MDIEQTILSLMGLDNRTILNDFVKQCRVLLKYDYITQEQFDRIEKDFNKT